MYIRKGNQAERRKEAFTNELGPLHGDGDHGEHTTPLRVKEYVAHGWSDCGEVEWGEELGGKAEGNLIRMCSKPPKALNNQKRTEPNKGRGFGETLPAYGTGEDDAHIQCGTRTRNQTTRSVWPRQTTGAQQQQEASTPCTA